VLRTFAFSWFCMTSAFLCLEDKGSRFLWNISTCCHHILKDHDLNSNFWETLRSYIISAVNIAQVWY
jgi:hypothetical protein